MRTGILSRLDDEFSLTADLHQRSPLLATVDSTFRGMGQVIFINNPLSGLIFFIAVLIYSPWSALLFIVSAYACTLTAHLFGYPIDKIRAGLYSFNGALIALLLANFLTPKGSWGILLYAVIAAGSSVPLYHAATKVLTEKLGIPVLSLPFSLVGLAVLLLMPTVAYGFAKHALLNPVADSFTGINPALRPKADADPVPLADGLFNALIRGVSEVFLLNSVIVGALVILGILISCRRSAVATVVGSAAASGLGVLLGADGYQVYAGLWGYAGALTAVALYGRSQILVPTWEAFLLTIAAAAASGFLYGALAEFLSSFGAIPLSLPFVLITVMTVLAVKGSSRFKLND